MADVSNVTMGQYGDKLRLFGLGGGVFDTQALLNATIATMELKNVPYQNQLAKYEEEADAWKNLKLQLEAFDKTVISLKEVTTQDRKVTNNNETALSVTATSKAAQTNYSISVNQLASAHKVKTNNFENVTETLNMAGTFKINDQEIEVTSDMTLTDLAKKINRTENVGVNAVVVGGSIIFTSTSTGTENAIRFEDSAEMDVENGGGTLLNRLGIYKEGLNNDTVLNEVQKAKDAKIVVDGVEIVRSTNVINDAVEGITFNLKSETLEGRNVNINIEQNDEVIKEKTKKFVDDFNTIIKYLNSITSKEAMLQGKTIPIKVKNEMLNGIINNSNSTLRAFDIGISVDGITKNGTVSFDAEKLAKRLSENPEEVMKLLTGSGSISEKVSSSLRQTYNAADGTITSTIEGLNKRISNVEKTISKNEESFARQQESLLKQFASYETTINSLNQQMKYMQSQIDSWNNSNKD